MMTPNPHSPPALTISIVSYNACEELRACLASLEARRTEGEISFDVIVTDNASSDGSLDMVKEEFPGVQALNSGGNLGYGRANNLAFQQARGRYFLILNSDTEMPLGALRGLCDFLDSHPEASAVSAQLVSHDGSPQPSAGYDPTLSSLLRQQLGPGRTTTATIEPHGTDPIAAEWLCGGCLCVRHEAYSAVKGFDPAYFMYLEDCDLSLRLRQAGGKLFLLPQVRVPHHLGASSRPAAARARIIVAHNQSCFHYFLTHHGAAKANMAKRMCVMGAALRLSLWTVLSIVQPVAREKVRLFREVLRGTWCIGAANDEPGRLN